MHTILHIIYLPKAASVYSVYFCVSVYQRFGQFNVYCKCDVTGYWQTGELVFSFFCIKYLNVSDLEFYLYVWPLEPLERLELFFGFDLVRLFLRLSLTPMVF